MALGGTQFDRKSTLLVPFRLKLTPTLFALYAAQVQATTFERRSLPLPTTRSR
jgi:hypothetical protein